MRKFVLHFQVLAEKIENCIHFSLKLVNILKISLLIENDNF